MLGVGGTPYAAIKRFFRTNGFNAGANAYNAKNGVNLNTPTPLFSVPWPFDNETRFAKLNACIFNTGGAPSYCGDFSE